MKKLCATAVLMFAFRCGAATFVVNTTADSTNAADGFTSLREAVIAANTNADADTILLPAGYYEFAITNIEDSSGGGDLDITNTTVSILGTNAQTTFIDAFGIDKIFYVGDFGDLTVSNVTMAGGHALEGAGIFNQGTTRLVRCVVMQNNADFYGGGISQYSGLLFIDHSTIADNVANSLGAGGIDISGGTIIIRDSTISGNTSGQGAGIYYGGGLSLELTHATIASNSAGFSGGGLLVYPHQGASYVASTIIAQNFASVSNPDVSGTIGSQGYNIIGNSINVGGLGPADFQNVDPKLQGLQYNGGTTPTHALDPASLAINRGNPADPAGPGDTDQRGEGFPRVRGVRVDIGAYEFENPDYDGDGIPDEWEMAEGLNPSNDDAAVDSDLDGFINADEYVADTQPTNGASFLHVSQVSSADEVQTISFPSSTGRLYQLHRNSDLESGTWTNLTDSVAGLAGETTFGDTNSAAASAYRVGVKLP